MTVAELIERLQQFPANAKVVTGGFDEGGVDDIQHVALVEIVPVKPQSHGPAYDFCESARESEIAGTAAAAVWIDWAEPALKAS